MPRYPESYFPTFPLRSNRSLQPTVPNDPTMKSLLSFASAFTPNSRRKLAFAAALCGATLTLPPLHAQETAASGVKVENAYVRAVPPNSSATAAFMTLINDTDKPVRLVGGSAPFAGMAAPMVTTHEMHDGKMAMGMKEVPFLEVPAHGKLELKSGGDHLMLMDLTSVPKEGEKVTLTLRFEPAPAERKVEAAVRK